MNPNYGSIGDTAFRDDRSVNKILESISSKALKISLLGNELENINKSIIATGNSQTKSDLLTRKEREAISLIEDSNKLFTHLASHVISDHATKVHAEKLKLDFQRVLHRFQRTQAEIKRRLLYENRTTRAQFTNVAENQPSEFTNESNLFGTTQVQLEHDTDADMQVLGQALDQEDQMRTIEEDIANVNIIFKQLSDLVYDQRTAIDSIEANLETAYADQEAGNQQLTRAVNSRRRRRKCCCIFTMIVVVTITILVLVLVIELSPNRS